MQPRSWTLNSDRECLILVDTFRFDSFSKLCDAVDHFQHKHFTSWRFADKESVNVEFYYPVLVVQGELLEGRVQKGGIALRPASHLQFRRTAIRRSEATTYQIDVVQEKRFARFVAMLESELELTVKRFKARSPVVRDSVSRIVLRARRLRSPEAVRRAMEVIP
jgi:hypothetical protein